MSLTDLGLQLIVLNPATVMSTIGMVGLVAQEIFFRCDGNWELITDWNGFEVSHAFVVQVVLEEIELWKVMNEFVFAQDHDSAPFRVKRLSKVASVS